MKKSSPSFWHYVVSVKLMVKILSNFVALLENLNFTLSNKIGTIFDYDLKWIFNICYTSIYWNYRTNENDKNNQNLEAITDYNQQQYSLIINSNIKIIRTKVMILSELLLEVMWTLVHTIILHIRTLICFHWKLHKCSGLSLQFIFVKK